MTISPTFPFDPQRVIAALRDSVPGAGAGDAVQAANLARYLATNTALADAYLGLFDQQLRVLEKMADEASDDDMVAAAQSAFQAMADAALRGAGKEGDPDG